ncbi:MAG: MFS transporter [Janthinobacterium lividum]
MKNELSRKIILSCFLAGGLEMYDFAIFGFLSATLHKNYLAFMDASAALIVTYALFAVGFVFRPLGSLIFGYIGDKQGRKKALVLSVTFMGTSSLAMAVLPQYALIGISSCYIIALIRIVQGISVGGEYSGALIYAMEHFDKRKGRLIGGIVVCGCVSGVLLATVVSTILQNPVLPSYSWRFAFLIGFGLSMLGYFIRKQLTETPEFQKLSANKSKIPVLDGIKAFPKECITTILTSAANGVNFYFILVFLPSYVNKATGLSTNHFPMVTTVILVVLSPLFGYISDRISRAKLICFGLLTISIYTFLGLNLLMLKPNIINAYLFFIGQAVIYSIMTSTINAFVIEIFPVQYRFSCSSVCYSLGLGVIGGTSPLIASLIVDIFEYHTLYISIYISIISLLAYIAVKTTNKISTYKLTTI